MAPGEPKNEVSEGVAQAEVESLIQSANRAANSLPTKPALPSIPKPRQGLARIVEKVFQVDVESAYAELEGKLAIDDALTPQTVRAALNRCEDNARLAHQMFVTAKVQAADYEREAEPVIGAMRRAANASLTRDKTLGKYSKQITDKDVELKMASMFPDEYVEVFGRIDRLKKAVSHLERLADLWKNRSFSLSALNGK